MLRIESLQHMIQIHILKNSPIRFILLKWKGKEKKHMHTYPLFAEQTIYKMKAQLNIILSQLAKLNFSLTSKFHYRQ